ncbi:hypothetical protein [Paraburkholderia dipogonis]|uniref:hypothetical protein n=1 Tax=Paraburkholderia dipogonis TaxID=1211383 RepID=UPI0038BE0A33
MTEPIMKDARTGFVAGASSLFSSIFSWPAFAVLLLVIFWRPLHQIGDVVPRLVESSDTVTIGKLTLQVRQNLRTLESQAGPDVRDSLSGMEAEDALMVLENNLTGVMSYSGAAGEDVRKWRKLERLGLVEELSAAELRKEEESNGDKPGEYTFAVRPSPTGKFDKLHKFLARAVFEIANASVTAASATEKSGK